MRILARIVPRSWDRKVHVAAGINLLHYPGGEWRFEHICDRAARNAGRIICAPELHPNHVIVREDPLTITASIVCPDCGLHGFVTDGAWVPA